MTVTWFGPWVGVILVTAAAVAADADLDGLEEQAIRAAVDAVAPSVVRIETTGGLERSGDVLLGEGPTTGLVVGADGWIVSSAFNFLGQPASILVTAPGLKPVAAQIVARDHSRKLVLLKANVTQPLPVAQAAPPAEIVVGQWAIAIGRSLDSEQVNVSVGVVSARNRIWGKAIQTDAKISPSNYGGPLTDIRGRVIGVLVPLSPEAQQEVAGAEWYDSGIGFAIPLVDLQPRLARLQTGKNISSGLLGVSFKEEGIYSSPAAIEAVLPRSPADEAGLRAGDTIVAVNGRPVPTQVLLKHALGPLDAGDRVQLTLNRGTQQVQAAATLTDELVPYEHPFLGLLPAREAAAPGVAVRFVYPESGAAAAGLRTGDLIVGLDGQPVVRADELRLEISKRRLGESVPLNIQRGTEKLTLRVLLSTLPTNVPPELPAAGNPNSSKPAGTQTGVIEVKVPGEPNACVAMVPENYDANRSYGLLVQLAAPGPFRREEFSREWSERAPRQDLIVLGPQPAQRDGWQPTETDVIRKMIDQMLNQYSIDRTRIVTCGFQSAGAMAMLTALRHRDLVRGTAAIDAAMPDRLQLPDNSPTERLAFYVVSAADSNSIARIESTAKRLSAKKHPVTLKKTTGAPRPLDGVVLEEFLRWIDTLDRI